MFLFIDFSMISIQTKKNKISGLFILIVHAHLYKIREKKTVL